MEITNKSRARGAGVAALALACTLASTSALAAPIPTTMLGWTLNYERLYPNLSTPFEPMQSALVAAGTGDAVTWGTSLGAAAYASLDAEGSSILFSALRTTSFIGAGATFDGFRITGFELDIVSVMLADNSTGLSYELGHDLRSIRIDLDGQQNVGSFRLDVVFATGNGGPSHVPEPATAWLALPALLGLAAGRRRRA